MRSILKVEICKALRNKWFYMALVLGCILSVTSIVGNALQDFASVSLGLRYLDVSYMELAPLSCYKYWLVTDFLQPATEFFFLLLPILATLPYAWSFAVERNTGYVKNIITRTSRVRYVSAKLVAVIVAGGLTVTIPIILNFILCSCIMPAYMPDIFSVIYIGIYEESLWSELYYTVPLLYCLFFTCLNFAFAGLWAATVFALSFFVGNRIALMIGPFLFLVFLKFLEEKLFWGTTHCGLTPFTYLRGTGSLFFSNGWVVLSEFVLMALFVVSVIMLCYRRDDL